MADSITPKIVNAIITIQPLAPTIGNRELNPTQAALALLNDGTIVRGFVINRDRNNNPVLRTPEGDFVVESEVFIKTGSEVVFRVDATQSSRARILSIDNLPVEEYAVQTAGRGLTEDTIAQSPLQLGQTAADASARTAAAQAAPVLQAILLRAVQGPAATPQTTGQTGTAAVAAQLAGLPAGAPITITVLDVKLPPVPIAVQDIPQAAGLARLLPPAPQNAAAATTPSSPALPNTSANTPLANLPPAMVAASGQQAGPSPFSSAAYAAYGAAPAAAGPATGNPTSAQPPAAGALPGPAATPVITPHAQPASAHAQATPQVASAGVLLQASVIGHGEDGANILHTDVGTLKVFTPQPLPTGTGLVVTVATNAAAQGQQPLAPTLPMPHTPMPLPELGYLSQALSQLATSDPYLMRALTDRLPAVGPKLTSGLLFFLSAVKQGNLRELLSPRLASGLDALAPELLTRLAKDIGSWHQTYVDSPMSDWKAIPLPLVFGNQAEPAYLYIRQDTQGGGNAAESGNAGQRFVIDLNFSQLGPMQFDGFVRHEGKRSLELFLRSAYPLEGAMIDGIRQIFDNALQTTGLSGQIVFQQGIERFVKPQAAPPPPEGVGSAHTILA